MSTSKVVFFLVVVNYPFVLQFSLLNYYIGQDFTVFVSSSTTNYIVVVSFLSSLLSINIELEYIARICKHFKEPKNRFPALWAGTITLFDVPARHAT
jgi:hypothetical protein